MSLNLCCIKPELLVFFVLADMQTLKAQFVADPMTNYLLIVWRPLSAAGEQVNITEQFRFSMSDWTTLSPTQEFIKVLTLWSKNGIMLNYRTSTGTNAFHKLARINGICYKAFFRIFCLNESNLFGKSRRLLKYVFYFLFSVKEEYVASVVPDAM